MAGFRSRIASYVEKHRSLSPLEGEPLSPGPTPLPSGTSVAVVGGGLAGPAFARRALMLAAQMGTVIHVDLLTRPSCNYCAGLITDVSLKSMRSLYELEVPPAVIRESINEVVYANRQGIVTVPLDEPLTSVLRTSRFRQQGFDESWVETVFNSLPEDASYTVRRGAQVTSIKSRAGGGFTVTYDRSGSRLALDADVVVLATGLKSLQQHFMQEFMADFGYLPPELMDSCVTEIDTSWASHYDLEGKILVVDGVIRNCIVAFIPKGRNWLTLTGLGKVLADHDLEQLFNHPLVKKYIELDQVIDRLRCRKICSATVSTTPAAHFYGEGWVMIGDLTGYGRALKDGYFAALQSASLAAETLLSRGSSEAAFREHYLKPLKRLGFDNKVGIWLFRLDQKFSRGRIGRSLLESARDELRRDPHGGLVTAGFRALFSGELSYKMITTLLASGMILHWFKTLFGLRTRFRLKRSGSPAA